jgi:hypothetical protein
LLSEEVCKKCINKVAADKWNEEDSVRFYRPRGFVSCPLELKGMSYTGAPVSVTEPPPRWCPYKLEHAVGEIVNVYKKGIELKRTAC